jgi:hypothetical protein
MKWIDENKEIRMHCTRSTMLFGTLFVAVSMLATPVLAQDINIIELDSGEIEVMVTQDGNDISEGACVVTCSSAPSFTDRPAHPFLGVHLRAIDHTMRAALDFEEPGIMVEKVLAKTCAQEAGVKVGDILLSLNGKAAHDIDRLQTLLREQVVGDAVKIKILRAGKKKTLEVTLGEKPAYLHARNHHMNESIFFGESFSGLSDEIRKEVECTIDGIDFESLGDLEGKIKVLVSELENEENEGDVQKEVRIFMTSDEE